MKICLLISGLILGLFLLGFQSILLPDSPSIASGISVDDYIEQSNIQTIDVEAVANQAKASRERYFAEKENSLWTGRCRAAFLAAEALHLSQEAMPRSRIQLRSWIPPPACHQSHPLMPR
jgi:hypothetical protein